MPITPNTIELPNPITPANPITFGSAGQNVKLGDGIGGLGVAPMSTPGMQHHAGGVWGGRQTEVAQLVTVDAPWTDNAAVLMPLRALMGAHPDPSDTFELRWAGLGFPGEHMMRVRPDGYEPAVDETAVHGGVWVLRMRFLAEDPTVWSADPIVVNSSASGSHSFAAANAGTRTVQAAAMRGAWSLVLTASSETVSPWIQIAGRRVTWQSLTIPTSETLTCTDQRRSILSTGGGVGVDGRARTPGEVAPHWPVLAPGANTVTLGAASGSFAAVFTYRSAW